MRLEFKFLAVALIGGALIVLGLCSSCCRTAPECKDYCKKVVEWAEHCKKPKMTQEMCENHYQVCDGDTGRRSQHSVVCWETLLKMGDEFDCSRIPEIR